MKAAWSAVFDCRNIARPKAGFRNRHQLRIETKPSFERQDAVTAGSTCFREKQTFFPSVNERQIASLMILMSFRLLRSINTVSALRATRPITGQRLNSFMAIKLLGQSAVIAKMSNNDMWLATTNTPFKLSDGLLFAIRRTFNMESASAQIAENSAFRCSTEALSNRLIRRTVENSQRSILNSREKRVKNGVE